MRTEVLQVHYQLLESQRNVVEAAASTRNLVRAGLVTRHAAAGICGDLLENVCQLSDLFSWLLGDAANEQRGGDQRAAPDST